jgi:SSS family transporter
MEFQAYEYAGLVIAGIVVFFIIRLGVGYWASRRVSTTADYIVAGRRLPIWLAAASIMATWFAAETLMGASSTAYQYGMQGVVFDPFGAALCLFLSGFFFVRLMRRARYLSIISFFDSRYGKGMGVLGSIAQIATYFAWTGAQIVAGGNIVHALLGWPVWLGMLLVGLIVIVYTVMGGLWADTALDFMQMFLTAGGITLIFLGVLAAVGGWSGLTTNASSLYVSNPLTLLPIPGEGYLGYTGTTGMFYWLAAWMAVGLGSIPTQDLMQRSMSSKNESVAVWGAFGAGALYLFFGVMSPLIGIAMFKLDPTILPEQTEFLLLSAAFRYLNPVLAALFIAALASALMSTSDSSVLAGASVFTQNVLPFFKKSMTDKDNLRWTRIAVVVIGLISVLIALLAGTIYRLAMVAWSLLLVGLFAPFAFGMYWKKANRSGAIAAFLAGFASWIALIMYYYPSILEGCGGDVECGMWDAIYVASTPAFIISLVTIVVVSLLTQKRDAPRPLTDVDGNPLALTKRLGTMWMRDGWKIGKAEPAKDNSPAGD